MEDLKRALYILLLLAMFGGGYYLASQKTIARIPNGMALVKMSFIDSLSNLKTQVITRDSIVTRDTIIYRTRPTAQKVDSTGLTFVSDSIINDSTHIVINDSIRGELISRLIEYIPKVVFTEVRVPYPVFMDCPTQQLPPAPERAVLIYGDLEIGGNASAFLSGINLGIVTPKNNKYGIGMLTDFNKRYYTFSYGKTFKIKY